MIIRNIFFLLIFCLLSLTGIGQEICDNGIDDDNDGLIDLNDNDCICATELPTSLIPNPSFEDRTCCPEKNAELNCAIGWIQASSPTTDYINTCGNFLGNTNIQGGATPPLPLADGEGAVGFRDGQNFAGSNYKEYVGACLNSTMKTGTDYRLQFYVGFRDNVSGSKSLDIAIFGSTNCANLPFGGNSTSIGCPANTGLYDELGIQSVSGSNEWVSVEFEFTATKDYDVIIIGPSCDINPMWTQSPYFYLDGLTLAETADFGVPFENVEGSICNDDLILSVENELNTTYQWYKNGVAIIGATSNSLMLTSLPENEGDYQVVIIKPEGCLSSKNYNVRIPPYYADFATNICEGESFSIASETWQESGVFETTISAADGCDSIITLYLDVSPITYNTIDEVFCEGELFTLFDISTMEPGIYETTLTNADGCDSILTIDLEEIPTVDGIEIENPTISLNLGDELILTPSYLDPKLSTFTWYTEDGNVVSSESTLQGLFPTEEGTYTIIGQDEYGCSSEETIQVRIDKSNRTIYTPNIFSPDDNNINDYFNFAETQAVEEVEKFIIFDRWGNEVFRSENITQLDSFYGWDGYHNGKPSIQGVYVWMIDVKFIDGTSSIFSGDITLVRL